MLIKFSSIVSKNHQQINRSSQSGAALIMSLVILAAITLLGVTNIESSSLEMKMVSAQKERSIRFAAAEAALARAEFSLENDPIFQDSDHFTTDGGCSGDWCFSDNCNNGLCFQGRYSVGDSRYECLAHDTGDTYKKYWEDESIWSDGSKHRTESIQVTGADPIEAKYIIEFLCFVENPEGSITFDATEPNKNNGEGFFRLSVFVEGLGDRSSSVMLQSTYIKEI